MKRGVLLFLTVVILISISFISAFEITGHASLDNSIWEIESEYPDAQFTTDAGITPDSFLYFAEDLIFSRFRSDLENREIKVAEIIETLGEGEVDAATRSLERYERYASSAAREVSPDQLDEVSSSAVAIRRAVVNSQIEEEFALGILNWEGSIITSAETAQYIQQLCTDLSASDPVQYSVYCQSTDDSPKWFRNLNRDLTRQQESEVRLFGSVMSECIESSGQTCSCESLSFSRFSGICSATSSYYIECSEGNEESCEEVSEGLPALLLTTEMPSYLENLFNDVNSDILERHFERHLPNRCVEAGALNPRDCREIIERERDSLFPIDPTPRVPPLDPTLPPITPPRNDTGGGGGSGGGGGGGGGSDPTPDPAPTPTISFSASPTSITSGSSSTLTWSSTNTDSCTSSGGWTGLRVVSGVQTVTPTQNTTYTLTCSGTGGSASSSVSVTVTTSPSPDPTPTPTVSFGANPTSITSGSSSTLTWSSTNAASCTASGGWSGSRSTSGTQSVNPTQTTTYTLTCSGDGGSASSSVSVTVTTSPPPPPPSGECDVTVNAATSNNVNADVNSASSGDIVCLVGSFDLSHTYDAGMGVREGVDNILFDLTVSGVVVDGSGATIVGDFDQQANIGVQMSGSNQELRDITIEVGFILVNNGASNALITRPTVSRAIAPDGNFGLIRILGGQTSGPPGTRVVDATLTDVYGCSSSATTSCAPGTTNDWSVENDVEHLACFTIQGLSDVTLSGATLARCPAFFYFKQFTRTQPVLIENVVAQEARFVGQCRSGAKTFNNVNYGGVPQVGSSDRHCLTQA